MTSRGGSTVEAALWMLAQLDAEAQSEVRRRLALKLDPPLSPPERRQRELRIVAELLASIPPRPGWSFAYVPRSQYDARRPVYSPSSATLVDRYGSWIEVCRHAYHLVTGRPNRLQKHRRRTRGKAGRRYSEEDAIAALHECARELKRTPSSTAYRAWCLPAERRRRGNVRYPSDRTISRLYAYRGGWLAALEHAGLITPPRMTVRVVVSSQEEAVQLAAVARAAGLTAVNAGNRNWIEVRGTIDQIRHEFIECTRPLAIPKLTLWEPDTRTLERADLRSRDLP